MNGWLYIMIFAIHAVICVLIGVLKHKGIFHGSRAYILIAILLPIFGPAGLFCAEWAARRPSGDDANAHVNASRQFITISVSDDDAFKGEVPMEEALILNDAKIRRAIMMNILHDEPLQYIKLLVTACRSDDAEVAHYATTTIMEIQRGFDLSIQKLDMKPGYADMDHATPDDAEDMLKQYISSGLLEGYPLRRIRERYGAMLSRKAEHLPRDSDTQLTMIRNKIDMDDLTWAEEETRRAVEEWPELEEAWLLGIHIMAAQNDRIALDEWIERMKQAPVRLSSRGRDTLQFWQVTSEEPTANPTMGSEVEMP